MKSFLLFIMLSMVSAIATASVGAKPTAYTEKVMFERFDGMKKHFYEASLKSGMAMEDIVAFASIESGIRSNVRNGSGSSATGVLQYTNRTWKQDRKRYHKELGLPANVDVKNPRANLLIGATSLVKTKEFLIEKSHLTMDTVRVGDLYMSHFLGENGAVRVLNAKSGTPMNQLYTISKGNRPLFYKPNGQVRTAREFRQHMDYLIKRERAFYLEKVKEHELAMMNKKRQRLVDSFYDNSIMMAITSTYTPPVFNS